MNNKEITINIATEWWVNALRNHLSKNGVLYSEEQIRQFKSSLNISLFVQLLTEETINLVVSGFNTDNLLSKSLSDANLSNQIAGNIHMILSEGYISVANGFGNEHVVIFEGDEVTHKRVIIASNR